MICRNDQNESNKQFNFNLERRGPKGSNKQRSRETPNHEKLRMQSTLISRIKKKTSLKNRRECNQEITFAEIEKTIKSFKNNKPPGNDGLPPEFYKTFNEILKTDLHKLHFEIPQLGQMPKHAAGSFILFLQKKRQRGYN